MALGASLYVRDGESYYHAKGQWRADPADNIASDMTEQARYLDGRTLRDPGRTRPCAADNFVCRAWTAAVRLLRAECDPEDFPPFLRPGERAKFIGWMRRGYRMAARRYSGVAEWRMCDLFQQIERAADEAIKHHDYEGQRFRFSVNVKRQTVQVRELYPEDDFS
jgi:hypothetical protein